jgi:hypothetical protein
MLKFLNSFEYMRTGCQFRNNLEAKLVALIKDFILIHKVKLIIL